MQDGDKIVVMGLQDLTRELGGISMTPVPGYAIISPDEEQAQSARDFFSKKYGVDFGDPESPHSRFASPRELLKKRTGLAASFFEEKDFDKIKDYPGWLVDTLKNAKTRLEQISRGEPDITPDSVVSVFEQGSWGPRTLRYIKLAELSPPQKDRVIELLEGILANPIPTPGGGTSNACEVTLDGKVITSCPQFHSVPGVRQLAMIAAFGHEILFKKSDKSPPR